MSKYTLHAGRCIVRDGVPLATLHGVHPYDPCDLDVFARQIVTALNLTPAALAALRNLNDALAKDLEAT